MTNVISKIFDTPDETHQPGRGEVAVISVGGVTLRRLPLSRAGAGVKM